MLQKVSRSVDDLRDINFVPLIGASQGRRRWSCRILRIIILATVGCPVIQNGLKAKRVDIDSYKSELCPDFQRNEYRDAYCRTRIQSEE